MAVQLVMCVECKKVPPVDVDTACDPHAFLRHEHGWVTLLWGLAMRVSFCSTSCLLAFAKSSYGQEGDGEDAKPC